MQAQAGPSVATCSDQAQQALAFIGTRDIPVLFLTAKTQSAERKQLAERGPAGILTKPFDPLQLPKEIEATLGW